MVEWQSVAGRAAPNSPVTATPHLTQTPGSSIRLEKYQIFHRFVQISSFYQQRNDGMFQALKLKMLLRSCGWFNHLGCKDYECVHLIEKWNWSQRKQNSGQGCYLAMPIHCCQWVCSVCWMLLLLLGVVVVCIPLQTPRLNTCFSVSLSSTLQILRPSRLQN